MIQDVGCPVLFVVVKLDHVPHPKGVALDLMALVWMAVFAARVCITDILAHIVTLY
jgi:hypothetical protein